MTRHLFSAMMLCLVWGSFPLPMRGQEASEAKKESLQEALEAIRIAHSLPGLMAGHFTLDGELELGVVGVRKASTNAPLRPDDRMHLGSCTKSMTATLIGILIDEGKLSFGTRLAEVFADDPQVVESPWGETTVDQLLRHSSGAVANPPWGRFASPGAEVVATRREILHWLTRQRRTSDAVGKFHYSNLGYVVLGHILETLRGHSWEDEMRQRLFDPLGMETAGFGPPTKAADGDAPWGHRSMFGVLMANEIDNPPALGPAGTVHASMADWTRYLRVHLMQDPAKAGVLPIGAETLARLHRAHEGETYAGGWVCGDRDWAGGRILNHNGSNTQWYCVVFLAPEQQRGIFAASNFGLEAADPCDAALQCLLKRFPARRTEKVHSSKGSK